MGEKSLNSSGASHAAALIKEGKVADDKSWEAPSPSEQDAYIAKHSVSELGKWYLAVDHDSPSDHKSHYHYPYSSDFSKASLRGLRAIITRASQAGATAIKDRAETLYAAAKKKLGKDEDKERSVSAVTKICIRKTAERLKRNEVLAKASEAAGYTANDLLRWLGEELYGCEFPNAKTGGSCCCPWVYPLNLVLPEHEKGEVWQAIVNANGCLWCVDFKLGEAGVEIVGEPKEVTAKDQYVLMDEIVEEASDEAAGRTNKADRQSRLQPGRMYRIFEISEEEADKDNLEIPVSFASELPGWQRCGGYDGRGMPTECERAAGLKSGQTYIEILDGDPDNVDHSTLNNSGAVLDEHDEKDQIGVVKKGSSRTDKNTRVSRATLKMDDQEKGRMRARQMRTGIRPHLSAGYKHTKHLGSEQLPDGRTAHRFAWMGMEISSVAVPLDGTIGVGRNYKELPTVDSDYKNKSSEKTKENSMTEDERKAAEAAKAAEIKAAEDRVRAETETRVRTETETKLRAEAETKVTAARTEASTSGSADERKRSTEIIKIADGLIKDRGDQEKLIRELANKALAEGTAVKDFQLRAMEDILKAKVAVPNTMQQLGYGEDDRSHYSLKRAIQNIINQADAGKQGITAPDPDTLEGEVNVRLRKAMVASGVSVQGRGIGSFLVPHDAQLYPTTLTRRQIQMMQRDATMQATLFGQGGASVATELLLPIVEILRNEMVTDKLGVTSMAGLEGNIVIPRQTAAATAYAVPETGALTLSGQLLDQIPMAPHRVGAFAQYSKQFLLQSSMDVENFIRTDLFAVMALIWDEYILNGQGGTDQPTGILNQNGVLLVNGTGAFTGYAGDANAPSWADIVNFDTQINKVNARRQGRGWATTSNSRGRLETLAKLLVGATTVASMPLWEQDSEPMGKMKGYPAVDSQQVPNDVLIFGVWALNVIHALWGGLDIVVDPYSLSTSGIVKIVMNTWGDVALRHPQEFCISLNAASA